VRSISGMGHRRRVRRRARNPSTHRKGGRTRSGAAKPAPLAAPEAHRASERSRRIFRPQGLPLHPQLGITGRLVAIAMSAPQGRSGTRSLGRSCCRWSHDWQRGGPHDCGRRHERCLSLRQFGPPPRSFFTSSDKHSFGSGGCGVRGEPSAVRRSLRRRAIFVQSTMLPNGRLVLARPREHHGARTILPCQRARRLFWRVAAWTNGSSG
jgi:hypothetical protein